MSAYPRLPELDPPSPGEPIALYGARALRFVIQHQITATLSTETLEQASMAARRASGTRADLGTKEDPQQTPASVYEHINQAQHLIQATLRARAKEQPAQTAAQASPQPAQDTNGGQRTPLTPTPHRQPPGGAYAVPDRPQQSAQPHRPVEIAF